MLKKLIFISGNKKSCQLIDKVVNILWITFENLFVMENNWLVRQMLLAKENFLFIIKMKRMERKIIYVIRKGIIMKISQVLKDIRQQHQLTQEALAEKLKVSRSAIARWESGKGIPDIGNLIAISREFELSLDQLIKEDERLEKKIVEDSKAKKWHYLVILYLFYILVYIGVFAYLHHIFMASFLVSTLFMLFYELRIFIKEKIWRQKQE